MSGRSALPLVLIPGHMGTALDWRYQIEEFAEDRKIIVPDQHFWLTSVKEMALDIAPRLPAAFDLMGWSMGGYIVFELFAHIRTRVRKTVLMHTTARPETTAARTRRQELLAAVDAEGMLPVFSREISGNMVDPSCIDADFRQALIAERLRLGKRALVNQIDALTARADARPSLPQVSCEVLVVAGGRDQIAPVECAEEIASLLPHRELRIFGDAGHCSPWEKPTALNALLRKFLEI